MQDRRRFLQMVCATAGTIGLGATGTACGGDDGTTTSGPVAAGNVSEFTVGDLKAVDGKSVAVGRDDTGFYALTTICTHEACDMAATGVIRSSGLDCSCHSSTFDRNGKRTGGPARSDLRHFKLTIAANGAITVQSDETVAADVRVSA